MSSSKCPRNCQCSKHIPHNTTVVLGRRALSSTYGDEQRTRVQRANDERHAKGLPWRGTPSDQFDWDAAIIRMRKIFKEVYE